MDSVAVCSREWKMSNWDDFMKIEALNIHRMMKNPTENRRNQNEEIFDAKGIRTSEWRKKRNREEGKKIKIYLIRKELFIADSSLAFLLFR